MRRCTRKCVRGSASVSALKPTEFWDREITEPTHVNWMHHPLVREHINASIGTAARPLWPLDWFEEKFPRRFARGLSIGCGTGALERDVIRRGICERIDAFDGSMQSLLVATREAGTNHIRYFASDFNRPALPRDTYDIVFFHHSLHHVLRLERLFRELLDAMKPDALLYLDEYIGPSSTEWNDALVAPQRAIFDALPHDKRLVDRLPLPIEPADPSEAIRASEILPQLRIGFDVVAMQGYGGNVLSTMFNAIVHDDDVVRTLIAEEQRMLAASAPPFHALIVATKKRNVRFARARYFLEPKLRGVRQKLWRVLGRKVPF